MMDERLLAFMILGNWRWMILNSSDVDHLTSDGARYAGILSWFMSMCAWSEQGPMSVWVSLQAKVFEVMFGSSVAKKIS